MHAGLRRGLLWLALALAATAIGAPIGLWYAIEQAPPPGPSPVLYPPVLVHPADGAATGPDPVLRWLGDAIGGHFVIEISGDPLFPDARTERHALAHSEFQRDEPFPPGPRVFWRVQAISWDNVESDWSATRHFLPLPAKPPAP